MREWFTLFASNNKLTKVDLGECPYFIGAKLDGNDIQSVMVADEMFKSRVQGVDENKIIVVEK